MVEHGGKGIDTPEVIGYGNEVSSCRDTGVAAFSLSSTMYCPGIGPSIWAKSFCTAKTMMKRMNERVFIVLLDVIDAYSVRFSAAAAVLCCRIFRLTPSLDIRSTIGIPTNAGFLVGMDIWFPGVTGCISVL